MNASNQVSRAETAALLRDMSEAEREVFASRVAERASELSRSKLGEALGAAIRQVASEMQAARDGESA